jgi:hypothetical protein
MQSADPGSLSSVTLTAALFRIVMDRDVRFVDIEHHLIIMNTRNDR